MLRQELVNKVLSAVNTERLVETAMALVEVPSPTCEARDAADRLAEILHSDGFAVERPEADWPQAPAVVTRLESGWPGRTLQFNGHLDTVHLPFIPPRRENDNLYGSGISDMKGGVAAALEAIRALRETAVMETGSVLFTAHELHEGPWGDKRQVKALIRDGFVGDAVLLPEYCASPLPIAGRGMAIFQITIRRGGNPVHEVLRPIDQPLVVRAGAELVAQLFDLHDQVSTNKSPEVGSDSVFVGQMQSGEIYNQSPSECFIQGTRRWITPGEADRVEKQFRELVAAHSERSGTRIELNYSVQGDAFRILPGHPAVKALQTAHESVTGSRLPLGPKPFLDDGNLFCSFGGIPAITHGPHATGAHTVNECCPIDELVRIARIYALTALAYCTNEIEVAEERTRDVLILLPIGRLDSGNVHSFESIVMEHITSGERHLIVDFSHLDFISSSGLRVTLLAAKALNANRGQVVLCAMKRHIKEVFLISGFDRIIPIKESREEALDVFT